MPDIEWLVTCEHGGNHVPPEYRALFTAAEGALASHRGFDPGALTVARALSRELGARLVFSETTRLLVDLNRSRRHPRLYSEFSRGLGAADKRELLARHYEPYRAEVEEAVAAASRRGALLVHVSAHSFTPRIGGAERKADVGLLFDPHRPSEARFAAAWRDALRAAFPAWIIRRNYPYRGTSDGLTTHLRKRFPDARYAGIELEVSQRRAAAPDWPRAADAIAGTIAASPSPEIGL